MHNSIAYSPTRWLDQFFQDFDRTPATYTKNDFAPAVDIVEEKEDYVLRAELPGVAKENIKVEVKENRLTLSGKKENPWADKPGADSPRGEYRYAESSYGSFTRVFELPRNVSGEAVRAEYNNGVLTLRIGKAKEALARTVEIK